MDNKDTKTLLEIVGGDSETLLFLEEWIRNGRNAKRAYLKLHPNVTGESAKVLGSRQLTKVNLKGLFAFYGPGIEEYIRQLKIGLEAKTGSLRRKYDKEGNLREMFDDRRPDYQTRLPYFQVLGQIFGFENKRA